MTVLANIAVAATNGTPAVAYACPVGQICTLNLHVLNQDAVNAATVRLFLVPSTVAQGASPKTGTVTAIGAVGSSSAKAASIDLVSLAANGGQMDRSGLTLQSGDSIQYDVGPAASVSITADGILGTM